MNMIPAKRPPLLQQLIELGCLQESELCATDDGFFAANCALSQLLARKNITTFPDSGGQTLECRLFFDDWYLYAVEQGGDFVCSLFKMREQEQDAKLGLQADGDTPGVTVSFIALQPQPLLDCLTRPDPEQRRALAHEIDRVVAAGGQRHSEALKQYFLRTEARAPYLIAELYTSYIASLAENGSLPVPERYAADRQKKGMGGRLPRFIEENNRRAGAVVCDHRSIFIPEPLAPTPYQRLAILATHTGNVSYYSFAAEIQFHARFLAPWARIRLPLIGRSPYASAIRADLSIGDAEFAGPTPYYRPNSRLVKQQYACHRDRVFPGAERETEKAP